MKLKKTLTALLLFSFTTVTFCQTLIESSGRARDKEYYRAQNIIPVFKLSSDTIEENNAFGVEAKFTNKKMKIDLPDQILTSSRNGYGYLYSGGSSNRFATGYLLFIITNNSRNSNPSLLFIDKNNDFNLSNDGPPDTLRYTDKEKYIFIKNPTAPKQVHIVKLSRFIYKTQYKYIQLSDSHYVKHSGTKEFMGTSYSFREQRLNVLAANYKSETDSFTIGFKDENCNGSFVDPGIDRIMIADYSTERFSAPIFDIDKNGIAFIETTGHIFKLSKLNSANASYFYVQEVFDVPYQFQLNEDEKVPKFKYIIADSGKVKKRKICKHRKKISYFYFTYSYAENFDNDTAMLRKIHNKYSDIINVVFLNSGDVPRQSKKIAVFGNLPYYCGISSAEIDEKWHIKTKPSGFLLKKRLKLHTAGMTPSQLWQYLEANYDGKEKKQ